MIRRAPSVVTCSGPRALLAGLCAVLTLGACTNSDLFSSTGEDPFLPDRVTLQGELCTEDTGGSTFPVKVLFVVDTCTSMFNADLSASRLSGPPGSVSGVVQRFLNQAHVQFGFVAACGDARPLPTPDGEQFFRPTEPEVNIAIAQLGISTGADLNVLNAISKAESFILGDMADTDPGEVLRTRYLVSMLFAGPPTIGETNPQNLAERADRLVENVLSRGALEVQVNVGNLYFGPRTIDQSPDPMNFPNFDCFPPMPGDPECFCNDAMGVPQPTGINGNPEYCSALCAVQGGLDETPNTDARRTYEAVAFGGRGQFRQFGCPARIDFNTGISAAQVQLVRKDIVAYNRNVVLTPDGPVLDSDGDGLTDEEELAAPTPTDPLMADTDQDGIGDTVEFRVFPQQDPLNNQDRPPSCVPPQTGRPDRDRDLLNDCEEGLLQTSATIPDTDGDGLPDLLEFMSGTIPISADDRVLDFDQDGIQNGEEVLDHTDPRTKDGPIRGEELYRDEITPIGIVPVASMEDPELLRGVSFISGSTNLLPGQAELVWDACAETLSFKDAQQGYVALPQEIPETGRYRLPAELIVENPPGSGNQVLVDETWIEVQVVRELMPTCAEVPEVRDFPLILVSDRSCYNVRISNIKLLQTQATDEHAEGVNSILVFFTQAPVDRLSSPGIAKISEIRVQFLCENPDDTTTCAREPANGFFLLEDANFISAP